MSPEYYKNKGGHGLLERVQEIHVGKKLYSVCQEIWLNTTQIIVSNNFVRIYNVLAISLPLCFVHGAKERTLS